VRKKLLGYQRFDTQDAIHAINDLIAMSALFRTSFSPPSARPQKSASVQAQAGIRPSKKSARASIGIRTGRYGQAEGACCLARAARSFVLSRVIDYKLKNDSVLVFAQPSATGNRRGKHVYYRERIIEGRSHVEEPWPAVQRYEAMIEEVEAGFTLG